ncbi:MAG: D-glycero-beta-D-manno-heptose 1-phosphate adenylyltransferase [Mangrovicoccus sp.]
MSLSEEFGAAMAQAAQAQVVVVGDLMLDRYIHGSVGRISPEGPVPVFLERETTHRLGGAGNVCDNLTALGVAPHLTAAVGEDDEGAVLADLVANTTSGADLIRRSDVPTTVKTRYVARAQQLMRVDREQAKGLGEADAKALINATQAALPGAALLILSDYAKGVLTDEVAEALIGCALTAAVPIIVDPKSSDFSKYRGATIVTPNLSELRQASGGALDSREEITAAARALVQAHNLGAIAVTLSEDGILIVSADESFSARAVKSDVYDVTGAGDTVVATLAACLAGGLSLSAAAEIAMVSAGIAVTHPGAVSVSTAEIQSALTTMALRPEAKVIRDWNALAETVTRWRAMGQKVGFANGVFDLLHPGHLSLLSQAATACDRLVVAINADESVKRLKGPTRPIQSEDTRARVLSAIEGVDAVTIFAEDTPFEVISVLKPDLLVKGSDYTVDQVVGADIVQANGGQVLLVDLVSGFSTTGTVAKITGDT